MDFGGVGVALHLSEDAWIEQELYPSKPDCVLLSVFTLPLPVEPMKTSAEIYPSPNLHPPTHPPTHSLPLHFFKGVHDYLIPSFILA